MRRHDRAWMVNKRVWEARRLLDENVETCSSESTVVEGFNQRALIDVRATCDVHQHSSWVHELKLGD
jgi:hypothetical protein